MACACKNRNRTTAGTATVEGTYRVMAGDRKVYESSSESAAQQVAARFSDARVLSPGQTA